MKKSLVLAAAVASLMAGTVQADAKVYGIVKAELTQADLADNWSVNDAGSRLGFKGSEDLGNGMKVVYQYEMVYDLDEGGGIGGARNSYVGLGGDFGTVIMGRHDTPAKGAFYAAGNDHLGDTSADLNSTYGFTEQRSDDIIMYSSNDMNGLKVAVAVMPGEGTAAATTAGTGIADGMSIAANYKSGPVKVGVGIQQDILTNGNVAAENATSDVMNLGGSYNMGDLTLGLQYQTQDFGSAATDTTITAFVAKFAMGKNALIASFGTTEVGSTDGSSMTLGYKMSHSKRTFTYVAFSDRGSPTGNSALDDQFIGLGIQSKF